MEKKHEKSVYKHLCIVQTFLTSKTWTVRRRKLPTTVRLQLVSDGVGQFSATGTGTRRSHRTLWKRGPSTPLYALHYVPDQRHRFLHNISRVPTGQGKLEKGRINEVALRW